MIISSCSNESTEKKIPVNTSTKDSVRITVKEKAPKMGNNSLSTSVKFPLTPIWKFDHHKYRAKQVRKPLQEELNTQYLVKLINHTHDKKIHLDFIKQSNDTIYVSIKESTYLTQSNGTTGASEYIQEATFTLTEIKGINYVNFDFVEGDHATPGVRSRKYFLEKG